MPLVIVAIGILALLLLIMRFKLNTFISLIIVSVGVALALGMPPEKIFKTIEAGLGGNTWSFSTRFWTWCDVR